jgi:hypothetical protein
MTIYSPAGSFTNPPKFGCSSLSCDLFSLRVTREQWNNANIYG